MKIIGIPTFRGDLTTLNHQCDIKIGEYLYSVFYDVEYIKPQDVKINIKVIEKCHELLEDEYFPTHSIEENTFNKLVSQISEWELEYADPDSWESCNENLCMSDYNEN